MFYLRLSILLCALCALMTSLALPDGGETLPVPGPGLAYGGIPYGSMSGNVAEFFERQGPSSGRVLNVAGISNENDHDYAQVLQYL